MEHVGPNEDWHLKYRSKKEIERWKKEDQVARLGDMLPDDERKKIELEVKNEMAAALAFAENSVFPGNEELYSNVYK